MDSLLGLSSGLYRVDTEASSYLVNLNKMQGMRIPGEDAGELRQDGKWFRIHKLMDCTVGQPMILLCGDIDQTLDEFWTRRSTAVRSIIESKGEAE